MATDRWINIGYDHDLLRQFVEHPEEYNDPIRIGNIFRSSHFSFLKEQTISNGFIIDHKH